MPRPSTSAPGEDPQHAVAIVRNEVARIRSALGRIERGLTDLEASEPASARTRPRSDRYLQVLVDVYERGGRHGVSPDQWATIGSRHGYDRRGLGGFFTGSRAPLRRSDDRVALTTYGERLIDEYLAGL